MFEGVVIKLSKNFSNISLLNEDIIISGSAVLDKTLSEFAMANDLSGFEFLACIPGTIGGGLKMNAGCFGKEIKDILTKIIEHYENDIQWWDNDEEEQGYLEVDKVREFLDIYNSTSEFRRKGFITNEKNNLN